VTWGTAGRSKSPGVCVDSNPAPRSDCPGLFRRRPCNSRTPMAAHVNKGRSQANAKAAAGTRRRFGQFQQSEEGV